MQFILFFVGNRSWYQHMDYYQILGVPRDCDREALRRAFRNLSRSKHPDRFESDQRLEAEQGYQQICIAFNTLKDDKQRAKYDKTIKLGLTTITAQKKAEDPAELARKYYKTGMARIAEGKHEQAAECFKRAAHYQPDAESYHQRGLAEAQVHGLRKDAVSSLQRAIELKSGNPQFYLSMVTVLVEFGLTARAKVCLEKALERFPNNEAMLEIGKQIDPKKYKKSLFGQLFGRN